MDESIDKNVVKVVAKNVQDWRQERQMWIRILMETTGKEMITWNKRIEEKGFEDEYQLRQWLTQQGVTGYGQTLLVMEQFGYPDFIAASAEQLIDAQYDDRPHLRPIFDAVIAAAMQLGKVTIQARKTYFSLLSPRRTFARLKPSAKTRLDLALRLDDEEPGGRLETSTIHESMKLQISFTSLNQVDDEALKLLQKAYEANCQKSILGGRISSK